MVVKSSSRGLRIGDVCCLTERTSSEIVIRGNREKKKERGERRTRKLPSNRNMLPVQTGVAN